MEESKLKPELIISGDGSHTLKVAALKEHYHSHKGALRESRYVFILQGLKALRKPNIRILEIGFGTGLNALLTALEKDKEINYHTLEPFPVDPELIEQLNYVDQIEEEIAGAVFQSIHACRWEEVCQVTEKFRFTKFNVGLENFTPQKKYDLVYYDAFAPHAQSELWEPWVWERLYMNLNADGVVVTYCAKGQVRRDMQSAGFQVERLAGPPGKREMLRATKRE